MFQTAISLVAPIVTKEALSDIPAITALAVISFVKKRKIKQRKKEFNQMIKFKKLRAAAINGQTGVVARGLKVTEYNFKELANHISQTNVKGKEAVAVVHVDGNGDESKHRIQVPTTKGIRVAQVGDVVVRHTVPKVILSNGLEAYNTYTIVKAADFSGYAK